MFSAIGSFFNSVPKESSLPPADEPNQDLQAPPALPVRWPSLTSGGRAKFEVAKAKAAKAKEQAKAQKQRPKIQRKPSNRSAAAKAFKDKQVKCFTVSPGNPFASQAANKKAAEALTPSGPPTSKRSWAGVAAVTGVIAFAVILAVTQSYWMPMAGRLLGFDFLATAGRLLKV